MGSPPRGCGSSGPTARTSSARSSMLTGQYPRTHGAIANGVPLPDDAPSVARVLGDAGYRTALIGKVHFEPIADPDGRWEQNRIPMAGEHGPYRGFEYVEFAGHGPQGASHYGGWLREEHPESTGGFLRIFSAAPGGDTGAPGVARNPVPREHYHTDWVADRTMAWLDTLDDDDDWFCWMSFPDPHHPWDVPASEAGRFDWRELDLPPGHPGSDERIREILAGRPEHWLAWYDGSVPNIDAAPGDFVPADLTHDQIREINALVHAKNELLDEAFGRVIAKIGERGWGDDTDVFVTTDHGEFQGELGLLYKGPYHVDALMRLPLVWRPAPSAGVAPAVVPEPVGQIDLAPTFCAVAGVPVPEWMEGSPLPAAPGSGRERAIVEWDSQLDTGHRLRTIVQDGWICTVYEPTDRDYGMPKATGTPASGCCHRSGRSCTTAARASCTAWPTTRTSGSTGGTIPRRPTCGPAWCRTCTSTCPRFVSPGSVRRPWGDPSGTGRTPAGVPGPSGLRAGGRRYFGGSRTPASTRNTSPLT
ncbi:sulfatase-like hydrolase/transferase [Actinomadura sp. CNU-125]|uniref:sulfatase-like hydrolase/transferase n=1 Tax=Actinomadura sp. CNU-125 TaxID=1904961 RepID=UPI00396795AE